MIRKKILLVIENSSYGGGERSFVTLARGISSRGAEVHAACSFKEPFYSELSPYARMHEFRTRGPVDLLAVWRLVRLISGIGPDIVHSQGARMDFYCALACRAAGTEHVSTVAMPTEGFDVGRFRKAAYRFFGGIGEMFTSRFIAVSGDLRNSLIGRHGIPADRVFLIPNAAGDDFFLPPPPDAGLAAALGVAGAFVIGAGGRLVWQKGFSQLLEAFAGLPRSSRDGRPVKLLIAGEGELEFSLRSRASSLGVSDRVYWAGFRSDMRAILSLCDIFTLPSLREGQPIAVIEAMASGVPIAASDLPGIRETAVGGEEILLSPPGDPLALRLNLRRLMDDGELMRGIGKGGRSRADRDFRERNFIDKHREFYGISDEGAPPG